MAAPQPEIIHTADVPDEGVEADGIRDAQDAVLHRLGRSRGDKPALPPTQSVIPVQARRMLRDSKGRLLPGQKGGLNPGGKGAVWREMQKYASLHCPEAIDFLVAVIRDPLSKTSDRLQSAGMLLDRGLGKPSINATVSLKEADDEPKQSQYLIVGDQKIKF